MKEDSRKKRIETILKKNFSPKELLVRDDSKKHEGHSQISRNEKETHFFIKMIYIMYYSIIFSDIIIDYSLMIYAYMYIYSIELNWSE